MSGRWPPDPDAVDPEVSHASMELADVVDEWGEAAGLRRKGQGTRIVVEMDRRFQVGPGARARMTSAPLTAAAVQRLIALLKTDIASMRSRPGDGDEPETSNS